MFYDSLGKKISEGNLVRHILTDLTYKVKYESGEWKEEGFYLYSTDDDINFKLNKRRSELLEIIEEAAV